jgi:hypothetical protein
MGDCSVDKAEEATFNLDLVVEKLVRDVSDLN